MADDQGLAHVQGVEHAADVAGQAGDTRCALAVPAPAPVPARRRLVRSRDGGAEPVRARQRLAVAAQVDGDDPVFGGQVDELMDPDGARQEHAVQQHDVGAAAPFDDVDPGPVVHLHEMVGQVAGQDQALGPGIDRGARGARHQAVLRHPRRRRGGGRRGDDGGDEAPAPWRVVHELSSPVAGPVPRSPATRRGTRAPMPHSTS